MSEPTLELDPPSSPGDDEPKTVGPAFVRTLRFQITLTYSIMLFGLASICLGGVYWGLSQSLEDQIARRNEPGAITFDLEQDRYDDQAALEIEVDARTLQTLRRYSIAGLAGVFVMSFAAGWFAAGRVLRPIAHITRVAREIQATDLSRRIGLMGPDDDLKQLAQTFDAMLDRLEHAFEKQQRLIHDTSHELRNPLAVMRTNLDVTLSDPDADAEQYRHTTEVVRRSAERMSKLVDDLLAYARHEAANRVEAPLDVAALIESLVDEFRGPAEQAGLEIRVTTQSPLMVLGHARSLEQALANLLANAVRFAPESTAIKIQAGQQHDWIWITVGDEGPGIPDDDRVRVFQRYVRLGEGEADRPHLAGGQGSGLGLAIVREIVQSHRGDVAIIDSDVGARFALWLPVHRSAHTTGEFRRRRGRRKAGAAI